MKIDASSSEDLSIRQSFLQPFDKIESSQREDSVGSNSLDTFENRASDRYSAVMILKAMVGLGIFVIPQCTKDIGILGIAIFYPTIVLLMSFFISMIIEVANELGYQGSR